MSQVELPFTIKQWLLNVGLHDVCPLSAVKVFLLGLQDSFDFFEGLAYFDSITSIGIFTGFNNPWALVFAASRGLGLLVPLVIKLQKSRVVFVFEPLLDVEREWQVVEYVIIPLRIVPRHQLKQCLLIPDHIIIY